MKIKIINKSKYPLPKYSTRGSAGLDLYANIEGQVTLEPLDRVLVPTGLYVSIPEGYEAQIRARSGLALRHGIGLANGIGTIDSDYRGEIGIILINFAKEKYTIKPGDRIAQLVVMEYKRIEFVETDNLDDTSRSEGGFGHSGY